MACACGSCVFMLVTIMPCDLSIIDEGIKSSITGMAHDGNAIGLGGYGLRELGGHLGRIPVGPHVLHIRARICGRGESAVIDDGLKATTR